MNTEEIYKIFLQYPQIITDSKKIKKNSIFWALKGKNFDGSNFIKNALNSGAEFAVTDNPEYKKSKKVITVNNSLKALQELALYHRRQIKVPILAITGTNGKTTTKELINSVLSSQYKISATKGNLNNHIGVPLTLLSINKSDDAGIIEMGANHPGEIEQLCKIAEPDFGLITNIGKAHLEGFGSFEGVIKAKSELYEYLTKNNGTIFFNKDNKILSSLNKGKKQIAYGTSNDVYLKGKIINANPFLKIEAETYEGLKIEINTKLTGDYNFENILAAACVGDFFNISIQNIKKAVENYIPVNNRSQIIKTEYNTIILDAYNANPASMTASINSFVKSHKGKKIIISGDMYELGKYSKEEHHKIIMLLKNILNGNNSVKKAIITGKYFKEAYTDNIKQSEILHFNTTKELETFLQKESYKNYTFLIKGSRAVKLENIVNSIP